MTSVLLWQLYRRQSNWRTYQSALVRSKKLLIKKRKQTLWLTVAMKTDIKNCYGLLLQRGLQEIKTTSDVLPKWFWRNQAKSDNDCDKNCPSELPSLHYDITTPLQHPNLVGPEAYFPANKYFHALSIYVRIYTTSTIISICKKFNNQWSIPDMFDAYKFGEKTLDRWRKSINYV